MDLKDPVLERYVKTVSDMGELAMRNIKTWKIDFDEQMEVYISSLKKSDNTKMVISSSFYKTFLTSDQA